MKNEINKNICIMDMNFIRLFLINYVFIYLIGKGVAFIYVSISSVISTLIPTLLVYTYSAGYVDINYVLSFLTILVLDSYIILYLLTIFVYLHRDFTFKYYYEFIYRICFFYLKLISIYIIIYIIGVCFYIAYYYNLKNSFGWWDYIHNNITIYSIMDIFLFIVVVGILCYVYYKYIYYIDSVQKCTTNKCITKRITRKILKVCPFIYHAFVILLVYFLSLISPWLYIIYIDYKLDLNIDYWLNIIFNGGFKIFRVFLSKKIHKTKKFNVFLYIAFIVMQIVICFVVNNILVFSYYLLLLINTIILLGSISIIQYAFSFKIRSFDRIFISFIVILTIKLLGFHPLLFVIQCIGPYIMEFFFVIFNLSELTYICILYIYNIFSQFILFIMSKVINISTIMQNYLYICFDVLLKLISRVILDMLNFISMYFEVFKKVKLTKCVFNFFKQLSCLFGYYTLKMDYWLPGPSGIGPHHNLSGGSGGSGSGGNGPGGNNNFPINPFSNINISEVQHFSWDTCWNYITPHSNYLRDLPVGFWRLYDDQHTRLNAWGAYVYDSVLNGFRYISNREIIAFRRKVVGLDNWVPINTLKLYLVKFRGIIDNDIKLDYFCNVLVHLYHTPLAPSHLNDPNMIYKQWGMYMPQAIQENYPLNIDHKNGNYYYVHNGPNPTLDHIFLALEDYPFARLRQNCFFPSIQIYLMQFMQDKRPDLFNRLMEKDVHSRLVRPLWNNLTKEQLMDAITQTRSPLTPLYGLSRNILNVSYH